MGAASWLQSAAPVCGRFRLGHSNAEIGSAVAPQVRERVVTFSSQRRVNEAPRAHQVATQMGRCSWHANRAAGAGKSCAHRYEPSAVATRGAYCATHRMRGADRSVHMCRQVLMDRPTLRTTQSNRTRPILEAAAPRSAVTLPLPRNRLADIGYSHWRAHTDQEFNLGATALPAGAAASFKGRVIARRIRSHTRCRKCRASVFRLDSVHFALDARRTFAVWLRCATDERLLCALFHFAGLQTDKPSLSFATTQRTSGETG